MIDPFDFMDWLKYGQWRVEIEGESWYDGQYWQIIIKDPLHIKEVKHIEKRFDIPLKQVLRDAIAKLSKTTRGHASLYSYRKRIEMEQK
jgi:hypothetical protein